VAKHNFPEDRSLLKIIQDLQDRVERLERALQRESDHLPAGGTTGQVLTKSSNADYDVDWA